MGGVCTGGTLKRHTGVDDVSARGSSLGYSGKFKSVKSFDNNNNQQQQKKDDQDARGDDLRLSSSSYTQQDDDDDDDDDDGYYRKTTSFDSGFFSSISRELKPSTPARVNVDHTTI